MSKRLHREKIIPRLALSLLLSLTHLKPVPELTLGFLSLLLGPHCFFLSPAIDLSSAA
jgi:hypothetical protein